MLGNDFRRNLDAYLIVFVEPSWGSILLYPPFSDTMWFGVFSCGSAGSTGSLLLAVLYCDADHMLLGRRSHWVQGMEWDVSYAGFGRWYQVQSGFYLLNLRMTFQYVPRTLTCCCSTFTIEMCYSVFSQKLCCFYVKHAWLRDRHCRKLETIHR